MLQIDLVTGVSARLLLCSASKKLSLSLGQQAKQGSGPKSSDIITILTDDLQVERALRSKVISQHSHQKFIRIISSEQKRTNRSQEVLPGKGVYRREYRLDSL
jgi:hypothetical protein